MGCMGPPPTEEDVLARSRRSIARKIDRELDRTRDAMVGDKKLLLLGAGESGKSTVFKQMKVMDSGYTPEECEAFKWIIHRNVLDGIRVLLEGAQDFGLELQEANEERSDRMLLWEGENINPEIADDVHLLWQDPAVQSCWARRAEIQIGDAVPYFMEAAKRIAESGYIPNVKDILSARVRTSGVVSKDFNIFGLQLTMYDVGGQRSERRKWIQFFDHVNAVIFVAAISEYDQVLAEDHSKNRLQEALDLFEQIVNSEYFIGSNILLFLNKRDLFEEKVKIINPQKFFPTYTGGCDAEKATLFFKTEFQARMHSTPERKARSLFSYSTCATDTGNMKFVFEALLHVIKEGSTASYGF